MLLTSNVPRLCAGYRSLINEFAKDMLAMGVSSTNSPRLCWPWVLFQRIYQGYDGHGCFFNEFTKVMMAMGVTSTNLPWCIVCVSLERNTPKFGLLHHIRMIRSFVKPFNIKSFDVPLFGTNDITFFR